MTNSKEDQVTAKLGETFEKLIEEQYGSRKAPESIVTPFGIKHLDALLGGGLMSSGPAVFCSTPETGKSTVAFQFSSVFQHMYPNSIIVYIDIEGSGNIGESTNYRISRIDSFGLDPNRFKYEPVLLNVMEVFEMINHLVEIKKKFEQELNKEFQVLIVWDSIPATPSSKTDSAEDANKVIGTKARQLSFCLEKYNPELKFSRITFIGIDQVRANMQIDTNMYQPKEKSVGTFKDMKAASNIFSLQHNIQQYVFLSKKSTITPGDGLGIDGWYIDVYTEKNKLAPSQHWVTCVFDKSHGIDKFWSEYIFLESMTPSEAKMYKNKKVPFDLFIKKSGAWSYLHVKHPTDSSIEYKSSKFYKKDAKRKYETDNEFRQWFDYAVDLAVNQRIINGLFILAPDGVNENQSAESESVESEEGNKLAVDVNEALYDVETGEVQNDMSEQNTETFDPETGEVYQQQNDEPSLDE